MILMVNSLEVLLKVYFDHLVFFFSEVAPSAFMDQLASRTAMKGALFMKRNEDFITGTVPVVLRGG